ncbi:hypothetical protein ACFLTD_02695 [Elusimicrobiota bacterium]
MQILLSHGADPANTNISQDTPADLASKIGFNKISELIRTQLSRR